MSEFKIQLENLLNLFHDFKNLQEDSDFGYGGNFDLLVHAQKFIDLCGTDISVGKFLELYREKQNKDLKKDDKKYIEFALMLSVDGEEELRASCINFSDDFPANLFDRKIIKNGDNEFLIEFCMVATKIK